MSRETSACDGRAFLALSKVPGKFELQGQQVHNLEDHLTRLTCLTCALSISVFTLSGIPYFIARYNVMSSTMPVSVRRTERSSDKLNNGFKRFGQRLRRCSKDADKPLVQFALPERH